MLIPPKYIFTTRLSQLLQSIEASKSVIDAITIPFEVEMNIRRQSTLKSSLFSARIEGNDLTLDDVQTTSSPTQKKAEVFNILKALTWLQRKRSKDITVKEILSLHKLAMNGFTDYENLGKFRQEVNAIFNSTGIAIYLPPRPALVPNLMNKLLVFMHNTKEPFVPIRGAITHYAFEKIHPFLDGNGRVGRLLLQKVLLQGGYGMKGLLTIEEYLDNHRSEYYRSLEESERDITDYIEFMLEAIDETAKIAKELVLQKQKADFQDYLLPRRAEILNIVKDHKLINFDSIRRRFLSVNERTLRYDLKKLADAGFIRKRGMTRGVYYEAINR